MHQCLEDLKLLLRSEISESEYSRVMGWLDEIIRESNAIKYNTGGLSVELMFARFILDRTNTKLYGAILEKLRQQIPIEKKIRPQRYAELMAFRNKMYQYRPVDFIPLGRSRDIRV